MSDAAQAQPGPDGRVDASLPNPVGVEFDNLYLDMNGIIHPAAHPEHGPAPASEEAMFLAICDYIDMVFAVVRPRKLLFMAVDGVAPRAKMNQQRARRFRKAQDEDAKLAASLQARRDWQQLVGRAAPGAPKGRGWDSNVITPGTEFMHRLSRVLHVYVAERVSNDPAWAGLQVRARAWACVNVGVRVQAQ